MLLREFLINNSIRSLIMKSKVITFAALTLTTLVIAACSTLPGKVSQKDLGIPDVAACKASVFNIDCDRDIGG